MPQAGDKAIFITENITHCNILTSKYLAIKLKPMYCVYASLISFFFFLFTT